MNFEERLSFAACLSDGHPCWGTACFRCVYILRHPHLMHHHCSQVEIFTGRPHQIRIHMAVIGHPIVGDPLFGVGGMPKVRLRGLCDADRTGVYAIAWSVM